jgi:hypothetical protein
MTAERPDFQSDSKARHVVKLNPAFQEIMRDDALITLPGETLGALPTLAQQLEAELTASSDGTIVNNPTIGGKTPEEIGELIQEHFDNLTPEQFDVNNRRANPHMYPETSQVDGAK